MDNAKREAGQVPADVPAEARTPHTVPPPGPHRARRRRKAGGRRYQHGVRVDEQEERRLQAAAAAAGLTVPHLLVTTTLAALEGQRHVSLAERRALAWEIETVRTALDAVGRNLNQLARVANATGEVPAELPTSLHALARRMARVDALLAAFGQDPRR